MSADIGFQLLQLCFFLSLVGCVTSLIAIQYKLKGFLISSRLTQTLATVICLAASIWMWISLFSHDYSIHYVFRNSSNDLPWYYTLSAFWSALEGSHLLWTLLIAFFSTFALWVYSKENFHLQPYISFTLNGILAWMYYLAATFSNPFEAQFPTPMDGTGMNELLQNPYMMIHPPILFTGYTALTIPFAYAISALAFGDITFGWLKTVRRWTLLSWTFLTAGIFLGGRWAYVELGWAGYWAWDPVENSSLMPWLLSTASLHTLIVQEKLGQLKRTSILLAIFAFFFSFLGTFITRSGIITSVHSFAQSTIGPNYLIFLCIILSVTLILYFLKADMILPKEAGKTWGVSRESALVVTIFLLLTALIIVFMGTMYPIISETITGVRFDIQAPYFNSFAPYLGFAFVLMIMVGNLLRFRSNKVQGNWKIFPIAMFLGLFPSFVFCLLGGVFQSKGYNLYMQILGVWFCFSCILCLVYDLLNRIRAQKWQVVHFFKRNLAYVGSFLAHVGLVVAILGFLGNYRSIDKLATLEKGQAVEFFGYELEFKGMRLSQQENYQLYLAPIEIRKNNKVITTIYPARVQYTTKAELLHEIDTYQTFWHDLYISLSEFDTTTMRQATFEFNINPTVKLVWISVFLLTLGGIVSLFDRSRGNYSKDHLFA